MVPILSILYLLSISFMLAAVVSTVSISFYLKDRSKLIMVILILSGIIGMISIWLKDIIEMELWIVDVILGTLAYSLFSIFIIHILIKRILKKHTIYFTIFYLLLTNLLIHIYSEVSILNYLYLLGSILAVVLVINKGWKDYPIILPFVSIILLLLTIQGFTIGISTNNSNLLFRIIISSLLTFMALYTIVLNTKQLKNKFHITNEFNRNYNSLTAREKEVVTLLRTEKSIPEICEELFISKKTTDTHIYRIYKKMKVNSRMQLIKLFQE